jgi:glycosyltransferase involved in cell wall biosynthesis
MRIIYHHRTRSTDAQRIHILEIIRAFEALGHQVEVVGLVHPETAQEDAKRDAGEAGWKKLVRRIPWAYEAVQIGYNIAGLPLLFQAYFNHRADFIYERYALFNFSGVLAAKLFRIPMILEVNGSNALEMKRDGDIRAYRFALWTERLICNAATHVVVVSTPLRKIMAGFGVRPEKLVVMTNGVNLKNFRRDLDTSELRRRLGLEGKMVIGFVGWFRNWHGLDLLLQAFEKSKLGARDVRLLLIGDGPEMANLQNYVKTHRMEDSVIFTGPLPHAEVPAHLGIIDIAVQPAANEYCCPMKILEYMGMGKPMVAPGQENIAELIDDGSQGYLFEPGDVDSMAAALCRMASDPQGVRDMGRRALETITERGYLWTNNAQRVIDLATSRPRPA